MIYHIYSVQKKHNEKEAFFQWFDNYLSQLLVFITPVANCSFLKAQEGRGNGIKIIEKGQALILKYIFFISFSMEV